MNESENTQEQTQETKKPIFVGSKQFGSEEELVKYTEQLHNKIIEKELNEKKDLPQSVAGPKPSELLFQDPDAFFELAVQEAESRVERKLTKKEQETAVMRKFWEDNKDLKDHEDLVNAQIAYKRTQYKDLPASQALSKIALEVRNTVSKIRGSTSGGKELSSGPAMVAGTSNGNTSQSSVTVTKSRSFVDQIRQRQNRGKS
ncbi:MAG: hypothetical protein EBX40_00580 [Gammaproteobacteria bacterium]|nr:hypothetical protein [Gammaproteobacteria bacterium]